MSKMKDLWGDIIEVVNVDGENVYITFTEKLPGADEAYCSMELDAVMIRQFIKKLMEALAEGEDK